MLAANGILKITPLMPRSLFSKNAKIGITIASIITVVAVLLINIEKHEVIIIRPSMINLGLDPNGFNKKAAKLASSLYLEAPIAKAKPPKK